MSPACRACRRAVGSAVIGNTIFLIWPLSPQQVGLDLGTTCSPASHESKTYGPVPVGCAFEYSGSTGASPLPLTVSASYFFSAVGDCMENDGSERAETSSGSGLLRCTTAVESSDALQLSYLPVPLSAA